jgi:ubiquinone/menaquinone biosynthesis C-methylase UbiE/uncharacterized protein YbaR (Trm112 family)
MVETIACSGIMLVCPSCFGRLELQEQGYFCPACNHSYPFVDGIPSFLSEPERTLVAFYENWHRDPHKGYNLQGIGKAIKSNPFIEENRWFFEKVLNTPFKRERFLKMLHRRMRKIEATARILDIGCGAGSPDVLRLGDCFGLDYCTGPLKGSIPASKYKMLVQGDATLLPFASEQFDCLVSSDVIGHIPMDKKERLFSEMSRVLKKGGLCGHIIETDGDNCANTFAKQYSDLYHKYFIEGIGGHFGLEPPSAVLQRFRSVGLEPIVVIKYFGYLRDMESFIALFDNEYREKSVFIKYILIIYKLLCRNFGVKILASVILGCLSWLIDMITPLNAADGILVLCKKK